MDTAANPWIHEWHNATNIHPLAIVTVVVLGIALLGIRRQYASWPLLTIACFVASAQRISVLGADFTVLRILLIFGTIRVLARGEYKTLSWNRVDTVLVCWALASVILPMIRVGPGLLMNRLGHLYDVLAMYFLFRFLIRDWEDVAGLVRGLMYISIPVSAAFAIEWTTGRNMFSTFGGISEITVVRDGRLRCQGAFSHSILAGCFWAAALPLMATQYWHGHRRLAFLSCGAALFIIYTCASATPIFGVLTACIGAAMYFVRRKLRLVRWSIVAALVGLHIVMEAPVWHLIARTSSLGGSSWHRYALVDGAIRHVHEWWLIGSSVGTAHWGHWTFDVTNYYIVQSVNGGVLLLFFFCYVIAVAFSQVGRAMRASGISIAQKLSIWAIGVSLLVHATNHFGVSYFGQIWLSWYMLLAIIGSVPTIIAATARIARSSRPTPGDGTRPASQPDTEGPSLNQLGIANYNASSCI